VRFNSHCGLHFDVRQQITARRQMKSPPELEFENLRMTERKKLIRYSRRVRFSVLLFLALTVVAWPQAAPDFSGIWKRDDDRSQPKRSGNVTLQIEHHDPELTVETTISPDSPKSRHAMQKYTTDG
jgi:hypothetical protein